MILRHIVVFKLLWHWQEFRKWVNIWFFHKISLISQDCLGYIYIFFLLRYFKILRFSFFWGDFLKNIGILFLFTCFASFCLFFFSAREFSNVIPIASPACLIVIVKVESSLVVFHWDKK